MAGILETWSPVTRDLGLIRAPLARVVQELSSWHSGLGIEPSRRAMSTGLGDALAALPPLSMSKTRRLLVPTTSDWVAVLQNGIDGSDPFPAMSYLAGRMQVLAMRVASTPEGARWPATIWEVYAPEALGGRGPLHDRRTIACANDGGRWTFHQSGEPYPFEEVGAYERRRKRDRFTRAMLETYLASFGVRPFADDFFVASAEAPAVLLERPPLARMAPEFSLAQVVAGAPWRSRAAK